MDVEERFAAIVLAAGESTRMGSPKVVLEYGDTTMVGAVVETAHEAGLDPVVVVTGFHERVVSEAVRGMGIVVNNPDAERGNMSSFLVGLDAAGSTSGVALLLADMPEVSAEVISELVSGVSDTGSVGGWVEYLDGIGHPVVIASSRFDELHQLSGTKVLWSYLYGLSDEERFVLRVDRERPTDVNTPTEYERVTDNL